MPLRGHNGVGGFMGHLLGNNGFHATLKQARRIIDLTLNASVHNERKLKCRRGQLTIESQSLLLCGKIVKRRLNKKIPRTRVERKIDYQIPCSHTLLLSIQSTFFH